MASKAAIVSELMSEINKTSTSIRRQLESTVGDVTVDILSQDDSRFRRLSRSTTITLNTTDTSYKLPHDFKTIKGRAHRVNSSGDYLSRIEIVDEEEFFHRKGDSDYGGNLYGYIEAKNNGDYLTINGVPSETSYIKLFYYREPTINDTDIVENTSIVKAGVRAQHQKFWPDSGNNLVIYSKMKSGVKESPATKSTGAILRPSAQTQSHNKLMHKIGRGR